MDEANGPPDTAGKDRRLRDAVRRGYAPPSPGRSRNMAAVKRANTKPEVELRQALHRAGFRFRKDYPIRADSVLVRPDIAFTRRRVAVFVDGCFWHGCPAHGQIPATNTSFWAAKLAANVDRDRRQDQLLAAAGWHVVRVWEHATVEDGLSAVESACGLTESPAGATASRSPVVRHKP